MAGFFSSVGNALGDLYGGTIIGRRTEEARQQRLRDARENNAFNDLIQQYGPAAGNPEAYNTLNENRRADVTQKQAIGADLRSRSVGAQRAGIGIARSIVDLPPDQQAEAIQHYAPILAQAYGTQPEEITSTLNTVLHSSDPHAALDALDSSLAPQSERELNIARQSQEDVAAGNNQTTLEAARIGANSRENVAQLRGTGAGHITPQAQALVTRTRQRTIANALQQIRIARDALNEGSSFQGNGILENIGRGVLQFGGGATAEGRYHTAVQALSGINIASELQALAAAGVHPGRQASTLTEREGQALATLAQGQDPAEMRRSLDELQAMYEAVDRDLQAQGGDAAPAASTASTGGADDVASYLGR